VLGTDGRTLISFLGPLGSLIADGSEKKSARYRRLLLVLGWLLNFQVIGIMDDAEDEELPWIKLIEKASALLPINLIMIFQELLYCLAYYMFIDACYMFIDSYVCTINIIAMKFLQQHCLS
jgi:hypothetical protein